MKVSSFCLKRKFLSTFISMFLVKFSKLSILYTSKSLCSLILARAEDVDNLVFLGLLFVCLRQDFGTPTKIHDGSFGRLPQVIHNPDQSVFYK